MNIAGLNNLGFQAAAKKPAAGKSSAQGKEKSSFESVLGETRPQSETQKQSPQAPSETKSDTKTETKAETKTETKSVSPEAKQDQAVQTPAAPAKQSPTQNDSAQAENAGESLPSNPSMPTMSSPGLGDRLPSGPVNTSLSPVSVIPQPAPNVQEDAANSLTRRVVWNDFLRKMNDLGVSAEDVLHAFGSLSEKDLALPPEQTVDKVVMALGLDGQQAALAKQYFTELVAKTKSKSFGEELASSNKQMSLTLMTQRELQRKQIQKSIENMDRSFFMPQPLMRPQTAPEMMAKAELPQMRNKMADESQPVQSEENDQLLTQTAGLLRPTVAQTPLEVQTPGASIPRPQAAPTQMSGLLAQMQAQSQNNADAPEDKKSIDQLIRGFNRQSVKAAPQMAMAAAPEAAPMAVSMQTAAPAPSLSPQTLGALNGIVASAKHDSAGDDGSTDDGTQDLSQLNTALAADQRHGDGSAVKGDFQAQMNKAAGQAQAMGVPDLVQQAHVMVRDGGGEMKVTLHPDGLGDVAMHVSVNDGKVSVQMITESDEAKKLIERQIGDLKSGLTQNHLQVDSIKVDTATNLGKQLEQQYQDAHRQQLQAAMEQFRQDTQGWRRSFFEAGPVNPYHSQGDAPRDVKAPTSAANAKARSARRLDLVA